MCTKAREEKNWETFFLFFNTEMWVELTQKKGGVLFTDFFASYELLWLKKLLSIEQRPSSCWL
jgi:hypothetical protein